MFKKKSKILTQTSKPTKFTSDIIWPYMVPLFKKFLHVIMTRNGQPLEHLILYTPIPNEVTHPICLENYVAMAQLAVEFF